MDLCSCTVGRLVSGAAMRKRGSKNRWPANRAVRHPIFELEGKVFLYTQVMVATDTHKHHWYSPFLCDCFHTQVRGSHVRPYSQHICAYRCQESAVLPVCQRMASNWTVAAGTWLVQASRKGSISSQGGPHRMMFFFFLRNYLTYTYYFNYHYWVGTWLPLVIFQ